MKDMLGTEQVPPGPADTTFTAATIARVGFMNAAASLADEAAKLVDPANHEFIVSDSHDLVEAAQALVKLAAIVEFEDGDPNLQLGPRPVESANYGPAIREWRESLERPWCAVDAGSASDTNYKQIVSTLPDGACEPERTCAHLSTWCEKHLERQHKAKISSVFRAHTPRTEAESIERHGQYLATRPDVTIREVAAHQERSKRVAAAQVPADPGGALLTYDQIPGGLNEWGYLLSDFWPEILTKVRVRDRGLHELLKSRKPVTVANATVVLVSRAVNSFH